MTGGLQTLGPNLFQLPKPAALQRKLQSSSINALLIPVIITLIREPPTGRHLISADRVDTKTLSFKDLCSVDVQLQQYRGDDGNDTLMMPIIRAPLCPLHQSLSLPLFPCLSAVTDMI